MGHICPFDAKGLKFIIATTRLPVTSWVTNTINDQFKCFCLNSSDNSLGIDY